ncbi:transcription antitermination factor NusB [Metamycoplasma neophronis]|uniref:Transcription antitermination protein NusB n=1 Tax=Metamycoplasma neophronis TaxID=872983 RepID=A0ABY2Z0E2_9BACT|nr:transcription antitermination factor NusB [Metamycoplasma neophronis]TPR54353.1 transcription antitermination protein NusB [Metamycoplasma neophronis]
MEEIIKTEKTEKEIKKLKAEDEKIKFLLKKYHNRVRIINFIYQSELFNAPLSTKEIFADNDLENWEVNVLNLIEQKYDLLVNIAKKFIDPDWEWNRINPLTRAIIIYGEYELLVNDPKVVINEMVNISKIFSPNNDYKFINKVLDLASKKVFNK